MNETETEIKACTYKYCGYKWKQTEYNTQRQWCWSSTQTGKWNFVALVVFVLSFFLVCVCCVPTHFFGNMYAMFIKWTDDTREKDFQKRISKSFSFLNTLFLFIKYIFTNTTKQHLVNDDDEDDSGVDDDNCNTEFWMASTFWWLRCSGIACNPFLYFSSFIIQIQFSFLSKWFFCPFFHSHWMANGAHATSTTTYLVVWCHIDMTVNETWIQFFALHRNRFQVIGMFSLFFFLVKGKKIENETRQTFGTFQSISLRDLK